MIRYCLLFCLILNVASAQNIPMHGNYVSGKYYVRISDSILEFKAITSCCFMITYYGRGKYVANEDTLFLVSSIPGKEEDSSYEIVDESPEANTIKLLVHARNDQDFMYYVAIEDRVTGITYVNTRPDSLGLLKLNDLDSLRADDLDLVVHSFSFDRYRIPLKNIAGKSVIINIADYRIIRDERIYFILDHKSLPTKISGPYFISSKEDRKEMRRRKLRSISGTIIRKWPWQWRFGNSDDSGITEFVKQNGKINEQKCNDLDERR